MDPIARWRADTPGCRARIHLNNAGASLMPRPVLAAMQAHLQLEADIGGYEAADAAADHVAETYDAVAALLGCAAANVAIVENATVAFAQALAALDFAPGDVIVTTRNDYVSNQLMYLSLARRLGVVVRRAADLPEGGVDPDAIRAMARDPRCRLVAVSWIPTNSGLVQQVAAVGAVCQDLGVPYLVDACQAVGQIPIDVAALGCDFLAATARKFLRGPRGIGFLYVSDTALGRGAAPLLVDMRGAEWVAADRYELAAGGRRFENWEFAYALVLGLGAAARYAADVDVAVAGARAKQLAASLRERLADLPGLRVLDRGRERCAIVTAATPRPARDVVLALRARGVNASSTERSSALIDMDDKGVGAAVRLSPHYYNTAAELDTAVHAIADILGARP